MELFRLMSKEPAMPLSFEETWLDSPALQWILQNLKQIGYAALVIVLLLVTASRFFSSRSSQNEKDYLEGIEALSALNTTDKTEESLDELKALVIRHPELQPAYDGVIGQQLLIQSQEPQAKPFIDRTFQRVEKELPSPYLNYAHTSLLISEGKQTEALEQAYRLKENMLAGLGNKDTGGGVLYAFNLMRIALLERTFSHKELEEKAWEELKNMPVRSDALSITNGELQKIATHFDDQGVTLKEFIN